MATLEKLHFGTIPWFELVGSEMCAAVKRASLPTDFEASFIERYKNGEMIAPGLVQGFRLDISGGRPSFRIGVGKEENADIVVDVTVEAIAVLARLYSTDPSYGGAIARLMDDGSLTVAGDPSRLGTWMDELHDKVCERTA